MKADMKKKVINMNCIRYWWSSVLVLLLVSIATVYCGMSAMDRFVKFQLVSDWNRHTVLTDYNDSLADPKV